MDGVVNFVPWKSRIVFILQENELWDEVVNHTQALPIQIYVATYTPTLLDFNKNNINAKTTILDAVKDHVIPHLITKSYAYLMWEALINLTRAPMRNERWF